MDHRQFSPYLYPRERVVGFKPDGHMIIDGEPLPKLENFDKIVVGQSHIEINGWIFPYQLFSKHVLQWMKNQFLTWSISDSEHYEWVREICISLHDSVRLYKASDRSK